MKPIQVACYSLLASAFMLGGLLVVNIGHGLEQKAHAEMVIKSEAYTVMTTKTKSNEEALLVLNNITNRLIVYRLDVSKNQMRLVNGLDLVQQFKLTGGAGGPGGNRGGSRGGRVRP